MWRFHLSIAVVLPFFFFLRRTFCFGGMIATVFIPVLLVKIDLVWIEFDVYHHMNSF